MLPDDAPSPSVLVASGWLIVLAFAALAAVARWTAKSEAVASPATSWLETISPARARHARAEADRLIRASSVPDAGFYVIPFDRHPWFASARAPEDAHTAFSGESLAVIRHLAAMPPVVNHPPRLVGNPASPTAIDGLEEGKHHTIQAEVVRTIGPLVVGPTVRWEVSCDGRIEDGVRRCDREREAIRDHEGTYLIGLQRAGGVFYPSYAVRYPTSMSDGTRAGDLLRAAHYADAYTRRARRDHSRTTTRASTENDDLVAALIERAPRSPHDQWAVTETLIGLRDIAPALARFIDDPRLLVDGHVMIENGPRACEAWGHYSARDVATLIDILLSRVTALDSCGMTFADRDEESEPDAARRRCAERWQAVVTYTLDLSRQAASLADDQRASCRLSARSGLLMGFERDGSAFATAYLDAPDGTLVRAQEHDAYGDRIAVREARDRCVRFGPFATTMRGDVRLSFQPLAVADQPASIGSQLTRRAWSRDPAGAVGWNEPRFGRSLEFALGVRTWLARAGDDDFRFVPVARR